MRYGPNPDAVYPNEAIKQVCFIKNTITRPNIIVGEYSYYDDVNGAEKFEEHVTHHYEFIGDKLIIGKFCAIAKGVEFIMNGANHRMKSVTTYPFNIMGGGWEKCTPALHDLPYQGCLLYTSRFRGLPVISPSGAYVSHRLAGGYDLRWVAAILSVSTVSCKQKHRQHTKPCLHKNIS